MLGAASLLLIAILISPDPAGYDHNPALIIRCGVLMIFGYRAALIVTLLLSLAATVLVLAQTGRIIAHGFGFARTILFYGLALGAGVILPLVIAVAAEGQAALAAGAVLAMFGALAFRYHLVMMPHEVNS
jgi:hypothetical protein